MLKSCKFIQIEKEIAAKFMRRFEHLGNIGLGVWHWGLMNNGKLLSVVSYGTPCFSKSRGFLSKIAAQSNCQIIQICRGGSVPTAPNNTASRIISLANRAMYKLKGPLLIVAYADPKVLEIGNIYQACSFLYTGKTNPKGQSNYVINGKKLSGWNVRKLYGSRDRDKLRNIDPNFHILPLHSKHRYVTFVGPPLLKREIRQKLKQYSQPYPKREVSLQKDFFISKYYKRGKNINSPDILL